MRPLENAGASNPVLPEGDDAGLKDRPEREYRWQNFKRHRHANAKIPHSVVVAEWREMTEEQKDAYKKGIPHGGQANAAPIPHGNDHMLAAPMPSSETPFGIGDDTLPISVDLIREFVRPRTETHHHWIYHLKDII